MRRMLLKSTGLEAKLTLSNTPKPVPQPEEVLVRVRAAGVNFADTLMMEGRYQVMPALPFAPGMEVAGEVIEVGGKVKSVQPGVRVAAMCGSGGFAEYVSVPEDFVVPLPNTIPNEVGAALLVGYGTAQIALRHRAGLKAGEWLVVTGAAGGTGLSAVEVGALLGANIIAIVRGGEKCSMAIQKGARHAIDIHSIPGDLNAGLKKCLLNLAPQGVHVIYDTVGGEVFKGCFRATAFEGRVLPIGFASGEVPEIPANHLLVKNISVIGFWWGAYFTHAPGIMQQSLRQIIDWAADGRIRPHIGARFELEDANDALAYLRTGKAKGKVLLTP